jgi:hypothetical protein
MQPNQYLVNLSTSGSWDEMPLDIQLEILKQAHEQERAERYQARVLRFQFKGYIALTDRQELWMLVEDWLETHSVQTLTETQAIETQAIERCLETRLRAVFDTLFRSWTDAFDSPDELNLTDQAWAQTAFHIQAVLPEVESPDGPADFGYRHAQIRATSADGLHRIRLLFCRMPVGGPYTCVNIMYYGPQRFRTFDDYNISAARGGIVEESLAQQPLAADVPRGLDDPRVFHHWHAFYYG